MYSGIAWWTCCAAFDVFEHSKFAPWTTIVSYLKGDAKSVISYTLSLSLFLRWDNNNYCNLLLTRSVCTVPVTARSAISCFHVVFAFHNTRHLLLLLLLLLLILTVIAGVGFSAAFVCLSVCFPHDISTTEAATITNIAEHRNVPQWLLETHLLLGLKVKGQGHEAQQQCRRGYLHSCECRLLLVIIIIIIIYTLGIKDPEGFGDKNSNLKTHRVKRVVK